MLIKLGLCGAKLDFKRCLLAYFLPWTLTVTCSSGLQFLHAANSSNTFGMIAAKHEPSLILMKAQANSRGSCMQAILAACVTETASI